MCKCVLPCDPGEEGASGKQNLNALITRPISIITSEMIAIYLLKSLSALMDLSSSEKVL